MTEVQTPQETSLPPKKKSRNWGLILGVFSLTVTLLLATWLLYGYILKQPETVIRVFFIICMILTMLGIPFSIIFLYFLTSNKEAWTMFKARFQSGVNLILESGDDGIVRFKLEKEIGLGVLEGATNLDYSLLAREIAQKLDDGTTIDLVSLVRDLHAEAQARGEDLTLESVDALVRQVKSYQRAMQSRETGQATADTFVNELSKFRYIAESTKTPVFLRYSGKAIGSSILVAGAATHAPIIAKHLGVSIRAMKNAFTRMITPSQMMHVAYLNQLIGAGRLGKKLSMKWIAAAVLLTIIGIYVILTYFGPKTPPPA